ncbi:MAG: hypothetical protein WDM76_16340 [Limisphaerales bacterium]
MQRKNQFSILKNLKVGQKLALMGVVFMLPFAVVTYKLITSVNTLGVKFAIQESHGLEYCAPLVKTAPDVAGTARTGLPRNVGTSVDE